MHLTAEDFIVKKKSEVENSKPIIMKDIGRKGKWEFKLAARTLLKSEKLDEKVFVFDRLEFITAIDEIAYGKKTDKIQYRICYYIVGRNGRMKGKWTWGQYSPMISAHDLEDLLRKAREEKTLL